MSHSGHSLLVGTYTETLPHVTGTAEGILGASYDPLTGAVSDVTVLARTRNPSYLALDQDGKALLVGSDDRPEDRAVADVCRKERGRQLRRPYSNFC